jgi:alkylation response protein AidB-like acyl-CoA dehydrogenase
VPIEDVTIHDEWFTMGLRGSGSTAVSVSNLFVPDARVGPLSDLLQGKAVANALADEVEYNGALAPLLAIALAYPPIGVAEGALELFLEKLPSRRIPYTQYARSGEAAVVQIAVAEASAKIDCAKLLVEKANKDIDYWAAERPGEEMPLLIRARIRRDTGYACNLCYEAVNILSEAAGGSFTSASNLLNRMWRDTRTISLHGFLANTTCLELYGRLLCGQEANTALV